MSGRPRLFEMSPARFAEAEQRIFERDLERYYDGQDRADHGHGDATEPTPLHVYRETF
jgi:hypothetical protein